MVQPTAAPRRLALATLAAMLLHGVLDLILWRIPWARPPHLRTEDLPEVFRELPAVSAPAAMAVAASVVGGLLGLLSLLAIEPGVLRRYRAVAGLVTGFWLFTALLTWLTWLSTPFLAALPGILLGIPRGLLVTWALLRITSPPGR
jgi:hypothetical protein